MASAPVSALTKLHNGSWVRLGIVTAIYVYNKDAQWVVRLCMSETTGMDAGNFSTQKNADAYAAKLAGMILK